MSVNAQMNAGFRMEIKSKCAPAKIVFYNQSTDAASATRLWDFGSGKYYKQTSDTLEKYFYKPGKYTIRLKLEKAGETSEYSQSFDLFAKPEAEFEILDGKACGTVNAQFKDISKQGSAPITSWDWDFRNGEKKTGKEVSYSYSEVGTYDVLLKITDANSCVSFYEIEDEIEVMNLGKIDFHSTKQYWCEPQYFSLRADIDTDQELNYRWHVGDDKVMEGKNVSVYLEKEGTYNVALAVWNDYGCYDSIIKKDYITLKDVEPVFDIKASLGVSSRDTICPGRYTITNESKGEANFKWYINDRLVSHERDLDYFFAKPGLHKIGLKLGTGGCLRSTYDYINIDNIVADFEIDKEYACKIPETFELTNRSTNAVSYKWSFADGTQKTDKNLTYTVSELKREEDSFSRDYKTVNVPVLLYATNARGCTNEIEKSIEFTFPRARFVTDRVKGCVPLEVNFTNRSNSDSDIKEYDWLIGKGNIDSGEKLRYTFINPGVYETKLVIINDSSCVDTSNTILIEVGEKLAPDFSVSTPQVCNAEVLEIKNLTPNAGKVDYSRYYSEGQFSKSYKGKADARILMDPTSVGDAAIALEVSNRGCISRIEKKNVYEILGPVVDYQYTISCAGPLNYKFSSSIMEADAFRWDFGDGDTNSEDEQVEHSFVSDKRYQVSLLASNATTGCADTLVHEIFAQEASALFKTTPDSFACVYHLPLSKFDKIKAEGDPSSGVAEYAYCEAEPYIWNFGDSRKWERSSNKPIFHPYMFKANGVTKISLVVEDNKGCTDTLSREYKLIEPTLDFAMDTTSGCVPGFEVQFTNLHKDASVVDYYWIMNNADTVYNKGFTKYTFKGDSEKFYPASLTVTDSLGCDNRITKRVELINPNPDFYFDTKASPSTKIPGVCVGERVYFRSTPLYTSDSSHWKMDERFYKRSSLVHKFNDWGTYEINHQVYRKGCTASLKESIRIEEADASFLSLDTIQECNMVLNFLHKNDKATVVPESSYWIFDAEGHRGKYKNDKVYFTYTKPGKHNPKLIIQTQFGCKDTSSTQIEILRPWAEYTIDDDELCAGEEIKIVLDTAMYATKAWWILEDLSEDYSDTLRHTISEAGKYHIGIHLENDTLPDCTYDEGIEIDIHKVVADFELNDPDLRMCLGSNLTFTNKTTGASIYQWYRNETEYSSEQIPADRELSELGNQLYKLVAKDEYSCSDSMEQNLLVVPLPEVSILGDYYFCAGGDSLQLMAETNSAANHIQWQPVWYINAPNKLSPNVMPDDTTNFELVVTSPDQCISSASVHVPFIAYPHIKRNPRRRDTVIYPGEHIQLGVSSSNPSEYEWTPAYLTDAPNEPTTAIYPEDSTVFSVRIKDICFENVDTFLVAVHDDVTLDMPTAFLPLGQTANRIVYVRGKGIAKLLEFKVFNRLGNEIFSTDNLEEGWDGRYRGVVLPADTYAYTVRVEDYLGYTHVKHGTILLIR